MPLYEYGCDDCGAEFEELVPLGTPDEEVECPECGGRRVRRRLSAFASAPSGSGRSAPAPSCGTGGFG